MVSTGKEEDGVPVGGELEPVVAGLCRLDSVRGAARDWLNPQLRCFSVLDEIYSGHRVAEPFAVGRDGCRTETLHVHHVFEGHRALSCPRHEDLSLGTPCGLG